MFVACVHIRVNPDNRAAFIAASLENARCTIREPGNLRFDVIQQLDDADRFMLYEVYRDEAASKAHKQTAHYARWRDAVEPWMAEPRRGVLHNSLFPLDAEQWAAERRGG
jgi:autoinducer 2-degrading protein